MNSRRPADVGSRAGPLGRACPRRSRISLQIRHDRIYAPYALDDHLRVIGLPSGGAVRASLGLASNAADLERFAAFAQEFADLAGVPDDLPARVRC